MIDPAYQSWADWIRRGRFAPHIRTLKSAGTKLDMVESVRPAGDLSRLALPSLVLCQDLLGGNIIGGDFGAGRFEGTSLKGAFYVSPPNVDIDLRVDREHNDRALAFPVAEWKAIVDEASDGRFSLEDPQLYQGQLFHSPAIRTAFRQLWARCDEEGTPSRLLAQAAGCEILAELCHINGSQFSAVKGGLAPWAEKRSRELMHARLSEDISLEELAIEARLSTFHFARMFKQSVGMPPRVYLTHIRIERACELLANTDLPVTDIAFQVGYSSNQVLARVFQRYKHISPGAYRRALRDPPSFDGEEQIANQQVEVSADAGARACATEIASITDAVA